MKKTLITSLLALLILACNKPKELKVTFVFDQPMEDNKYPSYFKDIVQPFFVNDCEITEEVLLKPINVVRADVKRSSKEINAWYFESMGELSVDFSKDWLNYYFTDSLVDSFLLQKTKNHTLKLNNYFKEGKTSFIFHDNSEEEEYNGNTIYSDGESLNKAIQAIACDEKVNEVFVLVNPTSLSSIVPQGGSKTETVKDGLDLKKELLKIVDTGKTPLERDQLAKKVWKTYFDKNASIKFYLNPNEKFPGFFESGEGKAYLIDRLAYKNSITNINIKRIEYHKDTNKISSIEIIECHKASQVQ